MLSVCGFILGALVGAALLGLVWALRRRRRLAAAGNGFPATGGYSPSEHTCAHDAMWPTKRPNSFGISCSFASCSGAVLGYASVLHIAVLGIPRCVTCSKSRMLLCSNLKSVKCHDCHVPAMYQVL